MWEGVINYLNDNPIQLILLILIVLLIIAAIVSLCLLGAKKRKKSKAKQTDDMLKKALTAINAKVAAFNEKSSSDQTEPSEKPEPKKREPKAQEKPAPYPTIDGLEEHYLPPKPPIPIRTTTTVVTPTPSKAPIPTIAKAPSGSSGKTVPIPMLPRVKPVPQTAQAEPVPTAQPTPVPTTQAEPIPTAQPSEHAKDLPPVDPVTPTTTEQTDIAASAKNVEKVESVENAESVNIAEPIEPVQAEESIEPTLEPVAEPIAEPETEQPEEGTNPLPLPEPIEEIENEEEDIELMKNPESKTPLAAKSALLAMQKMMANNPNAVNQAKPEPKKAATPAAKPEPKAAAKPNAKPEPKAAKAEPKTAAKAEPKTAAKAEPKAATVKKTETKPAAATFKSLKASPVKKKKPKSARYTGKWVICRLLLTDEYDEELEERYFFELRASNGEPLLTSEEYLTYEGAEKGIQTHKENILNDNFRIVLRGNEYVFKLLTAKNTLLCTGTPYKSFERCESAVASAKRFAATAIVQEEPEDVSVKIPEDDDFDTTEIDEAYIKGRWVIMTSGNERIGTVYYFELLDGAGKKLLVSEEYATYEGAVNAVATYQTNIAKGNFRISVTKRGDYMFKLLGGNNQLLCLGEHFPSRRRCEWAIEVVRAFSRNSAVYKYGE